MLSFGRFRGAVALSGTCLALASACGYSAAAPNVYFVATDLTDTTPGQDLWQYSYTITGVSLPFSTIAVHFGYASYADLVLRTYSVGLTPSPPAVQPDPIFGDGLIIVGWESTGLAAGGRETFAVDFVWRGGSVAPGSQVADYVDDNGFQSFLTASPAVPEPGTGMLMGTAIVALGLLRSRSTGWALRS